MPQGLHIAIDLLDALDHAHDAGVIHRDVKPDNIFLHKNAAGLTVTKLLDFGIVSVLDGGNRETAGRFLGTLRYAAPEQLRGEKATAKVDVYCAALVLYEMIAGRGPFDDKGDSNQIALAHLHDRAPLVSKFVVVPRELDSLLAAALAKAADGRPRDASSFAASLRNIKRAMGGASPDHASTGRQATGLALGHQTPAAPLVEVQAPAAPGGPYVVSPAPEPAPRTTVSGMPPPTVGRPFVEAPPQLAATAGHEDPVDRDAATRTRAEQAAPPADAPAATATKTIPMHSPLQAEGVAPIRFPAERPAERSDEPQVRSLPVTAEPRAAARVAIAVAVTGVLGLAVLATGALVLRRPSSTRTAPAAEPTAAATSSATSPPCRSRW